MAEVVMVCGYPASGKSTFVEQFGKSYVRLNRDTQGGSIADLLPKMDLQLSAKHSVVLDNLFPTKESRKPFIDLATRKGVLIRCVLMDTSIEDSMFNACKRMIERHGKVLSPEEAAKTKDPNMFPIAVLYKYRKEFEKPSLSEGFDSVATGFFVRKFSPEYKNRALILDYDGCLRKTKSGAKWPTDPSDVEILPGRQEVLNQFKGWKLVGASNQSGIAKGEYTIAQAEACFQKTNQLLGHDIEYAFCPHKVPPISCYCRKPGPGMGVKWIEKYKLNPKDCVMIGDMKTDQTFAIRCGFQFCNSDEFFDRGQWKKYLA